MMVSQSFNDASYVSAPTGPSRCNSLNSMYYYSAPASPSKGIDASFDFESEPGTPKSREDVTSNVEDFEFETSSKFYLDDFEFEKSQNFEYSTKSQIFEYSAVVDQLDYDQQERHREESLPSMAFADELFCNGRVVPLKLPPRLRADKEDKSCHYNSSTASSPRSPSLVLKLSFPRRSLWNDDFDPFTTALENVREEKRGRSHGNNYRRARSQSPLRNILPLWSSESKNWKQDQKPTQPPEPILIGPIQTNGSASAWDYPTWVPNQTEQMGPQNSSQQVGLSSYELAKPKGLGIARKLRPLKLGHSKTVERDSQETKRQGIRGLLFRSASMDKECSEHKQGEEQSSITVWKPQKMRSFSFKSLGAAHNNGKKRVAREMKSMIHYRPKLFLCMGFGFKAPRK